MRLVLEWYCERKILRKIIRLFLNNSKRKKGEESMKLHQWHDCDYRGNIVRVDYETTDRQGKPWSKYANVYVPFGYDPRKQYNILYLMHGGGGNPDAWLDASQIKNMLDLAFANKEADPFLVVFPTYYDLNPSEHRHEGVDASWEDAQVRFFQKEFEADLIPAIEGKFHTFAEGTDHEQLVRTRNHRAFGGFSMGGATTWYVFMNHLDIVATFLPLSGDCWAIEPKGGSSRASETAALLAKCAADQGFGKADFRLLIGTGRQDIAYENLVPQLEEMKKYPEIFAFSGDKDSGNVHFAVKEDAPHAYEQVYHHVYHYIKDIFR